MWWLVDQAAQQMMFSSSTGRCFVITTVNACSALTNAKMEALDARLQASDAAYLLSLYAIELGCTQIAGRPFEVSNNVPSNLTKVAGAKLSAVIYGNFAVSLIGMFDQFDILVAPTTDFAISTVGVRALQSTVLTVRHAESFAALQDAIP